VEKQHDNFRNVTKVEISSLYAELKGVHDYRMKFEMSLASVKVVLAEARNFQKDISTIYTIVIKQLNYIFPCLEKKVDFQQEAIAKFQTHIPALEGEVEELQSATKTIISLFEQLEDRMVERVAIQQPVCSSMTME
jgi:hypothetical protein